MNMESGGVPFNTLTLKTGSIEFGIFYDNWKRGFNNFVVLFTIVYTTEKNLLEI